VYENRRGVHGWKVCTSMAMKEFRRSATRQVYTRGRRWGDGSSHCRGG